MRTRTVTTLASAAVLALGLTVTAGAAAFAADEANDDSNSTWIDTLTGPDENGDWLNNSPIPENHDTTPDPEDSDPADESFWIDGAPAPLFVTLADLASGQVELAPGQSLIVTNPDGTLFTGTGGSDDDTVAHFDPASLSSDEDEATLNAGFEAGQSGTTTAWIVSADGTRTAFQITIVPLAD